MSKKWGNLRKYFRYLKTIDLPNGTEKFACPICNQEWKFKDNGSRCYLRCKENREREEKKRLKNLFKK